VNEVTGDGEVLLTGAQVGVMFRVDPKTVRRWAAAGKLVSVVTPEGRRFRESQVSALLRGEPEGGGS
jgi:predicted site-specific integrase-resolvase